MAKRKSPNTEYSKTDELNIFISQGPRGERGETGRQGYAGHMVLYSKMRLISLNIHASIVSRA